MKIFISYKSKYRSHVEEHLVSKLSTSDFEVWYDKYLATGADWWNTILNEIRNRDVVLCFLSNDLRTSVPCERERQYAAALNRHIVPVAVNRINIKVLPLDLQRLQIINLWSSDGLNNLVQDIRSRPRLELPDPLPDPPAVPLSDFSMFAEKIYDKINQNQPFSPQDEYDFVKQVTYYIKDPETSGDAIQLIYQISSRPEFSGEKNRQLMWLVESWEKRGAKPGSIWAVFDSVQRFFQKG